MLIVLLGCRKKRKDKAMWESKSKQVEKLIIQNANKRMGLLENEDRLVC
jgi:hypothetical protein